MGEQKQNPKYVEALKRGKLDYSVIPWPTVVLVAQAMSEGAAKYGRFNYREDKIEARTYIAAICRHLFGDPSTGSVGWVNGEDIDEESGLPHLIKIMTCCMVAHDAEMNDMMIDNRLETESLTPPSVGATNEYTTEKQLIDLCYELGKRARLAPSDIKELIKQVTQ